MQFINQLFSYGIYIIPAFILWGIIKFICSLPFNDYPVSNAVLTIAESRTTYPWNAGANEDVPYQSVIRVYSGVSRGSGSYNFWGDNDINLPSGDVIAEINANDNGKVETFQVKDANGVLLASSEEREIRKWLGLAGRKEALIGRVLVEDQLIPVFAINEDDPAFGREETEVYGAINNGDVHDIKPLYTVIEGRGMLGILGERIRTGTKLKDERQQLLMETQEDGVLLGDLFFHQGSDLNILGVHYRVEEEYPPGNFLGRPRSWFDGYSLYQGLEMGPDSKPVAKISIDARAFTHELGYEFWYDANRNGEFEAEEKLCTVVYGTTVVQAADSEKRTSGKELNHLWVASSLHNEDAIHRNLDYVDAILKMMPDAVNHHPELHNIEHLLDGYRLALKPELKTLADASTEEDALSFFDAYALLFPEAQHR
ncbi:hypothetical protein [Hahella sp. NBU794]|uniref:hypothetical protein n=1 Tax=Hahella sp. NBU794 TaxID=3422590 RepID=UPI003D6E7510